MIEYCFGNLGNALAAAGLEKTVPGSNLKGLGHRLTEEELLTAMHAAEIKLGHEPRRRECKAFCGYSDWPFCKRWGKWDDVLAHYRKWKMENESMLSSLASPEDENKDEHSDALPAPEEISLNEPSEAPRIPVDIRKRKPPEQFYGEPIEFRGLRHGLLTNRALSFFLAW